MTIFVRMAEDKYIELSELQGLISDSIADSFSDRLWIRAEISEIKVNYSGHCYMTLVEKDSGGDRIKAKVQAIVWASSYRVLKPFFESTTGRELSVGMVILAKVQVQYSELYGLSLIVYDLDPSFTVGEMELARQRTLARLKAEGMFDMNSTLRLPALPRRFAVITSETAAGCRDFLRHLHENEYGYRFVTKIFPAVMQGDESPSSIVAALDTVADVAEDYDAVLIIRGGGGSTDLTCFDDYELAVNVAQFPLPVITGIGHDHDYHIVDMVAHTSVKTPTALADFIIDIFTAEESYVDSIVRRLGLSLNAKFSGEEMRFENMVIRIKSAVSERYIREGAKIDLLERRVIAADPAGVLSKGYALVTSGGRRVISTSDVCSGDNAEILLSDGIVKVNVL